MKLHSPEFERALKRGVKKAVRKSPALKREHRAASKFRRQYSGYPIFRVFIWFLISLVVSVIVSGTGHPASALGVLSFWLLLFVFFHANNLFMRLFASTDLAILTLLPVSRDIIFRWEFQKFLRSSIYSLVDVLVALGTLARWLDFSFAKWCGIVLISILAWMSLLTFAVLCAARVRRARYMWVNKLFFPFLVASFFMTSQIPRHLVFSFFDHAAPLLNFLLPTGWTVSFFLLLLPNPDWLLIVFVVPVTAVFTTLPNSFARLRGLYVFREVDCPQVNDLEPGSGPVASPPSSTVLQPAAEPVRRLGPTEIIEIIRSRRVFALPRWPGQSWLETLLWRWFTPRERALSEFAFPNGLNLFKIWKRIAALLAIAVAVGFGVGAVNAHAETIILSAGIFIIGSLVLSGNNEAGTIFRVALNAGVRIPVYAYYPIGLPELARLLVKLSAVQIPLVLAWSGVSGILIAHMTGFPLPFGFLVGLRGGFLLFASRFVFAVFGFSSGTNDTQRLGLRNILLLFSIAPLAILFGVLGGISLFLPHQGVAWGMTVLAVLDAALVLRIYCWFYSRNFFDLMNLPQRRNS